VNPNILPYEKFSKILNDTIFNKVKLTLLEKVAKSPDRYVGIFRPTKPKVKLIQNITQSNEIRFGDAFEILLEEYLKAIGFEIIEKTYTFDGETLKFDQIFKEKMNLFFVEQKIRDDHDSTKKRGQLDNFEKKAKLLLEKYPDYEISSIMYFIDPGLNKNKNYYERELLRISKNYDFKTHLFYGKDFFLWLKKPVIWTEITNHLKRWKQEIPDFPTINFDLEPKESFEEIKEINLVVLKKFLENEAVRLEIMPTLFPEKKTLSLLLDYYKSSEKKNKNLSEVIILLESLLANSLE